MSVQDLFHTITFCKKNIFIGK